MKKIITVCLCLQTYLFAFSHNYKTGDTLNVFTKSGLKLREQPDLNSKVIELMNLGERIVVENTFEFNISDSIQGLKGNWIQVKHGEKKGYAFDAYLSRLPIPSKDLTIDMGCDLPDMLWQYGIKQFTHLTPEVKYYNWSDSDNAHGMTIQTLTDSNQVVNHGYYEGYEVEFFLHNIRFSEAVNLVLLLSDKCGKDISSKINGQLNDPLNSGGYVSCSTDYPGDIFDIQIMTKWKKMTVISFVFPCC